MLSRLLRPHFGFFVLSRLLRRTSASLCCPDFLVPPSAFLCCPDFFLAVSTSSYCPDFLGCTSAPSSFSTFTCCFPPSCSPTFQLLPTLFLPLQKLLCQSTIIRFFKSYSASPRTMCLNVKVHLNGSVPPILIDLPVKVQLLLRLCGNFTSNRGNCMHFCRQIIRIGWFRLILGACLHLLSNIRVVRSDDIQLRNERGRRTLAQLAFL